jgi:uncharacterized damage-inducible protein DinB
MSLRGRDIFLRTYDDEHARTMRVLRAYPEDQLELKPSPKSQTARMVAWTIALECTLGTAVWHDQLAQGVGGGPREWPKAPDSWSELLDTIESRSAEWRALIANASEEELDGKVHFYVAPKTIGEIVRLDWAWFLLHDQIHHRGQFSVYLRMAGGKVPSIYGPSGDEPWT